jgi:UDP-galactopyranose mutase
MRPWRPGQVDPARGGPVLVVGAGFGGAVMAERLATAYGVPSLVIDRRPHLGGMAHDRRDEWGNFVHSYGPHYFRTNSDRVKDYLSRFTEWTPCEYRASAMVEGRVLPFPVNLDTFEALTGAPATPETMEATLASWREDVPDPQNSEELVLSQVGRRLYDLFYAGYTRKHWGKPASELHPSVCGRIPVRTTRDRRYLVERFQAVPTDGYTALFERLLAHPLIEVRLETELTDVLGSAAVPFRHVVYTGALDELYGYALGPLEYRSVRWETTSAPVEFLLPEMQVNYPNDGDYTRRLEFKHALPHRRTEGTTVVTEFPEDWRPGKVPYYAMPTPDARAAYARYRALADAEPALTVLGRIGSYVNYNMDQVTAQALALSDELGPRLRDASRAVERPPHAPRDERS